MVLEVKLIPKLTYKLRLSPQMKLSLNLLQLPLVKLKEYVIEQVEKNPLLESIASESSSSNKQIDDDITDIEQEKSGSEIPWSREDEPRPCVQERGEEKKQYRESLITASSTLQEL